MELIQTADLKHNLQGNLSLFAQFAQKRFEILNCVVDNYI